MIIGIDPGVSKLGYSVISKNFSIETFGTIKTTSKDFFFKVEEILTHLKILIAKYPLEEAAIEYMIFNKNKTTALNTCKIIGIIEHFLWEKDIKIFEYSPLEIKKIITGSGKAKKEEIKRAIELRTGLKIKDKYPDSWDAISTGFAHLIKRKSYDRILKRENN